MKKTRQKRRKKPSQVYDTTLKGFMQQQVPDLLPVLLPGATYQETLDVERIKPTMRADRVYKIMYRGQLHIVDVEFQTCDDEHMISRLLAYHAILYHEYQIPVISLIIYLFRAQMVQSPWNEMSGDDTLLTFHFLVLPLFLLDAEYYVREHIVCMYPLLPTMRGASHELIGKAMDELAEVCHDEGILSEKFIWMEVLLDRTDTIDPQEKIEIQRRISMYEQLWAKNPKIKQIKIQAKKEGKLEEKRKSIIEIVEARFPDLTELATQRVRKMADLEELRQLMKQLAAAPDEAMARGVLDTHVA